MVTEAVKPGYKRTDIGVFPDDWQLNILHEIVEQGRPISYGIVQTGKPVSNGVKCVRVIDLMDGIIDDTNLITTSERISKSYRRTILKEGDLVIALRGKIGEAAIVEKNLVGSNLTRGVALIACREGLSNQFVKFQLKSELLRRILEKRLSGSALKELSLGVLRNVPIPLPPTQIEQEAIATVLSDTDTLIKSLNKLIEKKKNIKQGAMQELFTGKRRLPGFGGEWEVKKIGEIVQNTNLGGNYPNTEKETSYPLIKMGNIGRGNIMLGKIEYISGKNIPSERDRLQYGDVLFNTRNTLELVGKVAIWRNELPLAYYNSNIMKLEFNSAYISSNFFMNNVFNTRALITQLKNIATGTTSVAAIYTRDLQNVLVPIPKKAEQSAIAQVLSDMDAEIQGLEQKRDKYLQLKAGMMQELLTGKIRLKC